MHHWSVKFNTTKHFFWVTANFQFGYVCFVRMKWWKYNARKKNKEIMLLYWIHGHWKDLFNARDNTGTHNKNYTPKLHSRMDHRAEWLKQWQLYFIRVFEPHKCNKADTNQKLAKTKFRMLYGCRFCHFAQDVLKQFLACFVFNGLVHNMKCQDESDRYDDECNVLEKWYDCNFIQFDCDLIYSFVIIVSHFSL